MYECEWTPWPDGGAHMEKKKLSSSAWHQFEFDGIFQVSWICLGFSKIVFYKKNVGTLPIKPEYTVINSLK